MHDDNDEKDHLEFHLFIQPKRGTRPWRVILKQHSGSITQFDVLEFESSLELVRWLEHLAWTPQRQTGLR